MKRISLGIVLLCLILFAEISAAQGTPVIPQIPTVPPINTKVQTIPVVQQVPSIPRIPIIGQPENPIPIIGQQFVPQIGQPAGSSNVQITAQDTGYGTMNLTFSVQNLSGRNWPSSDIDIAVTSGAQYLTNPGITRWDLPYSVYTYGYLTYTINIYNTSGTIQISMKDGGTDIYSFYLNFSGANTFSPIGQGANPIPVINQQGGGTPIQVFTQSTGSGTMNLTFTVQNQSGTAWTSSSMDIAALDGTEWLSNPYVYRWDLPYSVSQYGYLSYTINVKDAANAAIEFGIVKGNMVVYQFTVQLNGTQNYSQPYPSFQQPQVVPVVQQTPVSYYVQGTGDGTMNLTFTITNQTGITWNEENCDIVLLDGVYFLTNPAITRWDMPYYVKPNETLTLTINVYDWQTQGGYFTFAIMDGGDSLYRFTFR